MLLGKDYSGYVIVAREGRKTPAYRLWYEDDLGLELKQQFLMSYMRSLEKRLRTDAKEDIEREIPFWKFLDIKFDSERKTFKFEAYYRQEAQGNGNPFLFSQLRDEPDG